MEMADQCCDLETTHGSHSLLGGTRLHRRSSHSRWRIRSLAGRGDTDQGEMKQDGALVLIPIESSVLGGARRGRLFDLAPAESRRSGWIRSWKREVKHDSSHWPRDLVLSGAVLHLNPSSKIL